MNEKSKIEMIQEYVGAKAKFTAKQAGTYYQMLDVQAKQDKIKIDSFKLEEALQKACFEHSGYGPVDVKDIYNCYKSLFKTEKTTGEISKRDVMFAEILRKVNCYNMVLLRLVAIDDNEDVKNEFRLIYRAIKAAVGSQSDVRGLQVEVDRLEGLITEFGNKYIKDSSALDGLTAYYYYRKRLIKPGEMEAVDRVREVFEDLEKWER